MAEQKRMRWLTVLFICLLAVAVAATIYGGNAFRTRSVERPSENVERLRDGWCYLAEGRRVEIQSLPAEIRDNRLNSLTLYRVLPDELPNGATLCLESRYQTVEVWIGETLVYEYGMENRAPVGWMLGSVINVIQLPDDSRGQTLGLRLTAPMSRGIWTVSEVLLGSSEAIVDRIMKSCINTVVFAVLFGTLGLLLIFLALMLKWKNVDFNRRGFCYLGLFVLIATLWVVTDSKLGQFLIVNHAALYLMSFLSFTLMPVPFLLFMRQFSEHGKGLLDTLCFAQLAHALLCIALYFTGTADFVTTLPMTHALLVADMFGVLFLCVRDRLHYHIKNTGFVLLSVCLLIAGGLASLLTFSPHTGGDNSRFFRYGLILFFLLLCYGSFRRGMDLLRGSMRAELYRAMAFKDPLTQLANRAAFDRDADALDKRLGGSVTLVMLDINGLKQVNDTYGHAAGDRLLADAAGCISAAFAQLGTCYRIGGDEFAVLLPGADDEQTGEALGRMDEAMERCDVGCPVQVSAAKGIARGQADGPGFIYRLLREADGKMYEEKGNVARDFQTRCGEC